MSSLFRSGVCALALVACLGCQREARRFHEPPAVNLSRAYDSNAFAIAEGKRLFMQMNCVGCHAHGGGAIGPPLMDGKWIYGGAPENIFESILKGRPNGMPPFAGKLPEQQVWQLVSYVQALSGHVRKDAAPGRADSMHVRQRELALETRPKHREKGNTP